MWSIVIRKVDENNEPKLVVYLKSSKPLGTPTQSMDVSLDINLYTRAYHRPSAHLNKDNQLEEQHGTQICTWNALKLTDEEKKQEGKPRIIQDAKLKRQKLRVRIKAKVNKTGFLHGDFMRGTNTPNEAKFVVGDTNFYVPKKHFDKLPPSIQYAHQPGSRY
ncbi:hypothetical protein CAEBREN_07831 [Caenorhabditis brenneri]|uniref:Uncharacterized protein n=1 Tax=Caenorhabditis brenneri TaxID=135651 RepID=G0P2Z1_CAEBE|nr:hypothetical protein CAEBREN_07831 [Caenorhabditis brenneri]